MRRTSISQLLAIRILTICALAVVSLATPLSAQKLRLSLTVSGRPSPYLADWAAHKETAVLTVNNTGGGTVEGRLHAKVLLDDALRAETRTDLMPVVAFPPGVSTYFADQFLPHDAVRFFGGVEKTATKTGMLPAGSYQLCVELLGAVEPKPLSDPACKQFVLTSYSLPTLLQPINGSILLEQQRPAFRWTPVSPTPPGGARYRIKIFELQQGQTPASVLRSGLAVFESEVASQTQLFWPPEFVPSPSAKKFAWSIQTLDAEGRTLGEPDGWSEPFMFSFTLPVATVNTGANTGGGVKKTDVKAPDPKGTIVVQPLLASFIKGRLVWAFRKSEVPNSYEPLSDASKKAPWTDDPKSADLAIEKAAKSQYPTPVVHTGAAAGKGEKKVIVDIVTKDAHDIVKAGTVVISGEGETKMVQMSDALATGKKKSPAGGTPTITPYAPELEPYAAPERHPLKLVTVNLYITYKLLGDFPGDENQVIRVLLGSATTDENGDFSISFIDKGNSNLPAISSGGKERFFSGVQIEIDEPHFVCETQTIPVLRDTTKVGEFSIGTVVSLARTFRLLCQAKELGSSKSVQNLRAEVLRDPMYYFTAPNVELEGNETAQPRPLLSLSKFGPGGLVIRVGSATGTAGNPRLFANIGGIGDKYRLRLTAPGYDTLIVSFGASVYEDLGLQIPTITKSYLMSAKPPTVQGRVVDKETKAALSGVTVGVVGGGQPKAWVTQTDAEGRFVLNNITPSQKPYSLYVIGKGVGTAYAESILLDAMCMVLTRDPLEVDLLKYPVSGSLVDEKGNKVAGALLRWKSGGDPVTSNPDGSFQLENVLGNHVLQIRRSGFLDKDLPVEVKKAQVLYGAGPNGTNVVKVPAGAHLGDVVLTRDVGRLLVTVLNKQTSQPIPNAVVVAGEDASLAVTAANGRAFLSDAPTGTVSLRVYGASSPLSLEPGSPAALTAKQLLPNGPSATGPDFVPYTAKVDITGSGDTSIVTVQLQAGGRASGIVSASSGPVKDASIRVDGLDEPVAKSLVNGSYTLVGIPLGNQKLRASKSGFLADEKNTTIGSSPAAVNFTLGESGFDISTLLGFPIEVQSMSLGPDTIINGAFVNIPSNQIFAAKSGETLPFIATITRIGGKLLPKSGTVVTSQPELQGKAYGFLPVTLTSSAGIEVKQTPDGFGMISGRIAISLGDVISSASGIAPPLNVGLFLVSPDKVPSGKADGMVMFSSTAMPYPADSLVFMASSAYTLTAFGFGVELTPTASSLKSDGFHLRGKLSIPDHPLLGNTSISLKELRIDKSGIFQLAALGFNPAPSLSLASWKMTLTGGSLNQSGLQVSGNLLMTLTQSSPSTIDFSGLNISADQVFGGQFTIPSAGIDLMGITKFKGGGVPLGLGNAGPGNILYLSGSGTFALPKLSKNISFDEFRVQSNGLFSAKATPNFNVDFDGLVSISLSSVEFSTISPVGIGLSGGFGLKIGMVNVAAGGHIKFLKGAPPQIDKLHIAFDIPAAKIDVTISYLNSMFTGDGSIKIPNTPIDFGVTFTYGKDTVRSSFVAAIPPILLGPYFVLDKIGGGFSYGAKSGKFSIWVDGGLSVTGTSVALSAYPIRVTVESGPIIMGEATLNVFQVPVGKTAIIMDFPQKLFSFFVDSEVELLPSVKSKLQGLLTLSLKQDDSYFLLGCNAQSTLLHLFDVMADFAAGWNVNLTKHPELYTYVSFVPQDMLSNGNTVNGVHLNAYTIINVPASGDIGIATGEIHYLNESWTVVNFNFEEKKYGLSIGSGWTGGGSLYILGEPVAGLEATASGSFSGSYNPSEGWNFCGKLGAKLTAWIGNCSSACENKLCWCGCFDPCAFIPFVGDCTICPIFCGAKLCVGASVRGSYKSTSGLHVCVDVVGQSCTLCD